MHKVYISPLDSGNILDSVELVSDCHGIGHGYFVLPQDSCRPSRRHTTEYVIHSLDNYLGSTIVSTEPKDTASSQLSAEPTAHQGVVTPDDDTLNPWPCHIFERGTQTWDTLRFAYIINPCQWPDSIDVSLTVERLGVPQGGHWITPTAIGKEMQHTLSEREYRKHYPHFAYDWRVNNTDAWNADTPAFNIRHRFPSQKEGTAFFPLPPLKKGVYRNTLTLYNPRGQASAVDRTTFYSGRMPHVTKPFNCWLDTADLQVGDTLLMHFETWLPNQQAVVSIQFNNREPYSRHIRLSSDTLTLAIPIEEEGVLSIHIASAFHGEMVVGTLHWRIGELGKTAWEEHDDNFFIDLLPPSWRTYRHSLHRPPLDHPLRNQPLPNIWDYLGIAPHTDFIEFYCPGEYWPWRTFSNTKRIPGR